MNIAQSDLFAVLAKMNPWWQSRRQSLPQWRRAVYTEMRQWVADPPARRAVSLTGPRQVGKTTLLLQLIQELVDTGTPAPGILYISLDHPILKLAGIDRILSCWEEMVNPSSRLKYVFLDEMQSLKDWGTWVKLKVDFDPNLRIVFTGSAMSLNETSQESGAGRWHTCRIGPLSFYEYLKIRDVDVPNIPAADSLRALFDWNDGMRSMVATSAERLTGYFTDYLLRGGFPQAALMDDVDEAQKLIREDIVDRVLKRDMTVCYGVRHVVDLENLFLYLCMHDGGMLDIPTLCRELEVNRPTVQNYLTLLESAHMLFKLPPFGAGKQVLRPRWKIYLSDPSMAPSILLKGRSFLENPAEVGQAAEGAVCRHLAQRLYRQNIAFSYWKNSRGHEVDFIGTGNGTSIPFEVKYRGENTGPGELKGLIDFMTQMKSPHGYVLTKRLSDFSIIEHPQTQAPIMKIPVLLFCWWMGENEIRTFAI